MNMTEKYFRSIIRESLMTISKENKALNEGKFTNALATGLLGLATLGPMTSCEKNEPDIDKGKIETTNNKNKGSEEKDKQPVIDYGDVSKDDVEYCSFKEEVKPNQANIGEYNDGAEINFYLEENSGGTTLTLDLVTPDKGTYCIEFDVDKKKNLTPSKWYADNDDKEEFIKIFSKYRIGDDVYDTFDICPPKLSLENIGNANFYYY